MAFSFLVPFLGFLSRVYLLWRLLSFGDFPSWTYLVLQAKFFPLKQVLHSLVFIFKSDIFPSQHAHLHPLELWEGGIYSVDLSLSCTTKLASYISDMDIRTGVGLGIGR